MKKQYLLFLALSLTLCSAFSQVPNYVPTSGLVGWWPFNGNANDISGNGLNGAASSATLTTDRFGASNSAYSFNGSSSQISVPDNNLLDLTQFTVSAWALPTTSSGAREIVAKGEYPYNYGLNITGLSNNPSGFFNSNNLYQEIISSAQAIQNQWSHIVLTHNGSSATLYLNGVSQGSQSLQNVIVNNGILYFGRTYTGYYFTGKIDDIGIWNRALTQCEITDLYNASLHTLNVSAGADQTVCSGTPVTLSGSGASTYSWSNGVTNNTPFTPTTSSTYTVTVTDANTCTATDQVVVQVTELPTVTEGTNNICPGSPVTLTASSPLSNETPCASEDLPLSLQSGLVGYWPFCGDANDESGNGNNGTVNGQILSNDRFGNVTSSYLFSGNNTQYISLPSNPISGSGNFSISFWFKTNSSSRQGLITLGNESVNNDCIQIFLLNNQLRYDLTMVSGPIGTVNINDNNWHHGLVLNQSGNGYLYIDGAMINSVNSMNPNISNTGTKRFGGDRIGIGNTQTFSGDLDDVGIWNRALTPEEITQLYNIGSQTYSWSTGETTESISVSPTSTSTYTCDVTVNGQTCSDDVMINVIPNSSSSISETVCNTYTSPDGTVYNTSGTYTAVIPNAAGCDSTITINLTVNNSTSSTISPTACDNYTAPDGTVYTTDGTYTAVIPNAAGCDSTITINLTMNNSTSSTISPTACDAYTAPDGAVFTTGGTYTAVIPNAAGCDSTITINLTLNNSTSSTISPTVCDTYTAPDGTVYTTSGTHTAVIPNAIGCDSTITINLTVNNSPTVNAGADQLVCEGTQVTLSASGASSYAWSNGITNGTPFTPAVGTVNFNVTGTDANGCEGSDNVLVTVTIPPVLNLISTSPECPGEASGTAEALVTGGTVPYSFLWSNGSVSALNNEIPAGTYSVILTDNAGCSESGTVIVTDASEPCFFIPGGLSPNGDGNNDTWSVNGLNAYPDASIMVYNRWGQLLYDAGPDDAPWDGTYLSEELPTADYYYIIDLGNGETFNGVITLKR